MKVVWPRIIKCCSQLCAACRVKENWQKQYGTIPKSLCTCFLVWSITGTSALMGTRPQLESCYFNDLIDPNSLVHKLSDYDILNHILCWIADFLMDRRQRVKLAQDCFSEWCYIPAGFPRWRKLRPTCTWLFLIMINDLNAREADNYLEKCRWYHNLWGVSSSGRWSRKASKGWKISVKRKEMWRAQD